MSTVVNEAPTTNPALSAPAGWADEPSSHDPMSLRSTTGPSLGRGRRGFVVRQSVTRGQTA